MFALPNWFKTIVYQKWRFSRYFHFRSISIICSAEKSSCLRSKAGIKLKTVAYPSALSMRCLFYMIHSLCINFDMIKAIIFGCFRVSYRIKNTFLHFITIFDRSKCFDKEKATHLRLEISQLSYYGYLISNLEKLRHIFKLRVSYPECSWIKHSVGNHRDESEVWERVNLLRHCQSEWPDWSVAGRECVES